MEVKTPGQSQRRLGGLVRRALIDSPWHYMPLKMVGNFRLTIPHVFLLLVWLLVVFAWFAVTSVLTGTATCASPFVHLVFVYGAIYYGTAGRRDKIRASIAERTETDPRILRKRGVKDKTPVFYGQAVRLVLYFVFALTLGFVTAWVKYLHPITPREGYILIYEQGALGNPPISTHIRDVVLVGVSSLLLLERVWVTRWYLRKTKLVKYALFATLALATWLVWGWYWQVRCWWPYYFIFSCP
jgi:hypothetical protein